MLVLNAGPKKPRCSAHNTSYRVKNYLNLKYINLTTTSGVNICFPIVFSDQTKIYLGES